MEAVNMIKPTSKAALKGQCLYLSGLDIAKAEKMYDFLVKDMKDLPDVEPATKPLMDNVREQANGILGWFRENQDVLSQGVDMIRGIVERRKGIVPPPVNPLPPING